MVFSKDIEDILEAVKERLGKTAYSDIGDLDLKVVSEDPRHIVITVKAKRFDNDTLLY